MVKVYNHIEDIDYADIFLCVSPVVKSQTIKVVLALAISMNWKLKQLDVNNAYLNDALY